MISPSLPSGAGGWRSVARSLAWPAALLASLAMILSSASTPWISDGPRVLIQTAYQTLCHQQAGRSFEMGGTAFAVCHRCFGIYVGIALGLLGLPIVVRMRGSIGRHAAAIVVAACIPLVLDWGLDVAGLWANTGATRFVTGLFAGVVGGLFLNLALITNMPTARGPRTAGSQTE